jgi:hypothetical protein
MSNREYLRHQATGYAQGREDVSGIVTKGEAGSFTFAEAFQAGWDDMDAGKRGFMIPTRDAYDNWQASNGASIFKAGDTTAECMARIAYADLRAELKAQSRIEREDYRKSIDDMGGYSDSGNPNKLDPGTAPHRDLGTGYTYSY